MSDTIPPDLIVPKGALRVSRGLLDLVKDFAAQHGMVRRNSRYVAAITWSDGRSYRLSDDSERVDQGPGLDLGGLERHGLPAEAIHVFDGVEVVLQIPSEAWRSRSERLIDLEERDGMTEVVLR